MCSPHSTAKVLRSAKVSLVGPSLPSLQPVVGSLKHFSIVDQELGSIVDQELDEIGQKQSSNGLSVPGHCASAAWTQS